MLSSIESTHSLSRTRSIGGKTALCLDCALRRYGIRERIEVDHQPGGLCLRDPSRSARGLPTAQLRTGRGNAAAGRRRSPKKSRWHIAIVSSGRSRRISGTRRRRSCMHSRGMALWAIGVPAPHRRRRPPPRPHCTRIAARASCPQGLWAETISAYFIPHSPDNVLSFAVTCAIQI